MELPKGAVWMVGIGLLGLTGTGVAYFVGSMSEGAADVSLFEEPIDPPPEVQKARSQQASQQDERTQGGAEQRADKAPEPRSCRALVNVRVGGAHDDVYDYRVLDVTFALDGSMDVERGTGAAVAMPDGNYALQLGMELPGGLPQQQLQARAIYEEGLAEMALWSSPDLDDGLAQNDGYILWPVHQNYARLRATIDRYVAVHHEVVNSEGGMRDESGGVVNVQSGESARPLKLEMDALRGRAAAFAHQKVANQAGSEMIWEQFEDRGEGDFLLRLANGPGKSVQPEAGLCCYEEEGASQMIFVQLDRGAFALMAPGYLSRPDGFVRGGEGCGEFGWDGESLYARRRDGQTWKPIGFEQPQTKVQELLGVYWLPVDDDFDASQLPPKPTWPTTEQLSEHIEPSMATARAELEQGNGRKAAAAYRKALRLRLFMGREVTEEERLSYNKAVALSGHPKQIERYFDYRMRVSDSAEEKKRIERMKDPEAVMEEFRQVNP